MANLLIGLAVSDIPDLARQGKVKKLSKQAYYLEAYEIIVVWFKQLRFFPRTLREALASHARIPEEQTIHPNKRYLPRSDWFQRWCVAPPFGEDLVDKSTEIVMKKLEMQAKLSVPIEDEIDDGLNPIPDRSSDQYVTLLKLKNRKRTQSLVDHSSLRGNSNSVTNEEVKYFIKKSYDSFERECMREFRGLKQYVKTNMISINNSLNTVMKQRCSNKIENDSNTKLEVPLSEGGRSDHVHDNAGSDVVEDMKGEDIVDSLTSTSIRRNNTNESYVVSNTSPDLPPKLPSSSSADGGNYNNFELLKMLDKLNSRLDNQEKLLNELLQQSLKE